MPFAPRSPRLSMRSPSVTTMTRISSFDIQWLLLHLHLDFR